jgi:hypothetical protein
MQFHERLLDICAEKSHASRLDSPNSFEEFRIGIDALDRSEVRSALPPPIFCVVFPCGHIRPLVPFREWTAYVSEDEPGLVRNSQRVKSSLDASLFQFFTTPSFKGPKPANGNRDGNREADESKQLRPAKCPTPHEYALLCCFCVPQPTSSLAGTD